MAHLNDMWCPGGAPNITSPFKTAAAAASQAGCGIMISADNLPPCRCLQRLLLFAYQTPNQSACMYDCVKQAW